MARTCRFQFHLGPFRAAFLALLLLACASGTAGAGTKAEHLYLLAGTPLRDETDSYPVTLYAVGPNGHIETVREIFSKRLGLFGVRDDLEGRLYVMNEWQNILSVIHESDPERDDVVKNNFGCMYETAWGIVAPPGQGSSAIYPNTCAAKPWKVVTVAGAPAVSPRISEGRGNWSLYCWFRYRGAPVTPRAEVMPEGNIAQGRIMVPFQIGFPGSRVVRGRLMPKPVQPGTVGIVGGVPPNLPQSVGTHQWTVEDARGTVHLPTRLAVIVADTPHFFAFAALPVYSKKWPVPVYVRDKTTERWRVVDTPFVRLWPRVFGSWLATTVEEPNPSGKASPGLKNERTLPPYAYKASDLPQVRGLYGTKTYMPGKLLLQNLVDDRKLTIDTGQQDSEVLDVRKDGLVLYRVNNEIFSAQIDGDKLSAPKLVVKGEDVPEVHWVFWSKAEAEPQALAAVQPFSVTLGAPNKPLKVGAELRLRVTVKNISNRDITFIRSVTYGINTYEGFRYMIHVLDSKAHPAPPSARIVALRQVRQSKRPPVPVSGFIENHSRKLKPGQSFVDEIDITRYYDLSQRGVYRIWVTRPMPPRVTSHGVERPKGSVRSNTITVTVVK